MGDLEILEVHHDISHFSEIFRHGRIPRFEFASDLPYNQLGVGEDSEAVDPELLHHSQASEKRFILGLIIRGFEVESEGVLGNYSLRVGKQEPGPAPLSIGSSVYV